MRPKCRLIHVLAWLSLPLISRAAEPLALDEAIQTALHHNARLAYGSLAVDRQRMGVTSARQEFDPELSPNGTLNNTEGNSDWRSGIRAHKKFLWGTEIGLGAETTHYPTVVDEAWRSAIKLDVRQPLFRDFGRLVNEEGITAASERLRAEERRWELQKADIIVDVVRSFETIIRLQKQIDCDKAILERTDKLRELTRIRERQGRASHVDTLRIELLYGQAQSRQEAHREELFSATRELAELLGFPPEKPITLAPAPLLDLDVPPMEIAIQTSFSNRLDFAQSIDDYRSLQRQVKLARHKLEPALYMVAESQQYGQDTDFSDSLTLDKNLWTVGLAGQMDLLQHRDKTAVSTSELDVEAGWAAVHIKMRTLAREIQQAVSAYRQVRAEFAIAGRNYEAAQARTELAGRLFAMGRGDNFAVSDAETAFIDAESSLLSTRARICMTGYNLLRLMGTLTDAPPSLKPRFTDLPL
ncbi:MAG: TolC family protein [bacterium]